MKKNIVFISISLGLIMLLGIRFSYSLWNISVSQDTTNLAESKCFDLSISNKENNINLDNAYPISNDKGKSLIPYTFTVTNTCDITAQYNINLEVLNTSTLSSKFIDVMFEGNINLLSSYDTTDKVNTSSIESRKLTTGILKSKESRDYSLRLWIDYNTTLEDLNNEAKSFKSKIIVVGKPINYTGDTVFNFDYTGAEQTFIVPVSGTYKLETWGAQGGSYNDEYYGGYGGYSTGIKKLIKNNTVFINAGGSGFSPAFSSCGGGGYNGGGNGCRVSEEISGSLRYGGGGATHIATKSGLLKTLKNSTETILIVSGGGGGGKNNEEAISTFGGSGGGAFGVDAKNSSKSGGQGGSQTKGGLGIIGLYGVSEEGSFGMGGQGLSHAAGGGGGYYGGSGGTRNAVDGAGGGGSGYIGNTLLTNKVMYCYNCEESNEESTKTISTTCSEEIPTSYCAKKGNGYARITLISIDN